MSTNYFAYIKDKSVCEKYGLTYELTDEPDWGYKTHIAKRSAGWKPLFQSHSKVNNIDDVISLINEPTVTIYNEYLEPLTVEEFTSEVIEWGNDEKNTKSHIQYNEEDCKKYGYDSFHVLDPKLYHIDDKGFEFLALDFS